MNMEREQLVRERAFVIWEAEGRPTGCEREHWERAEREIDQEGPGALAGNGSGASDGAAMTSPGEAGPETGNRGSDADVQTKATANPSPRRSSRRKASKTEA
jgi:hypothetical protein